MRVVLHLRRNGSHKTEALKHCGKLSIRMQQVMYGWADRLGTTLARETGSLIAAILE